MKLALLVNIIAPYRLPIYKKLGETFETFILTSGIEKNRASWQGVEEALQNVVIKRSWGGTIRYIKKWAGKKFDYKYVHINPGYIIDLLKINPDVLITSEMGLRTLIALLYGKLFNKPVWIWWGGTIYTERLVGPIRKLLRKVIVAFAQQWISYGETSTEYLMYMGVQKGNILQIQNCVDEQLFLQKVEPAVRIQPKPVFLYVGQLIKRKGVDKLLFAAHHVQKEGYDFSLLLVGDGLDQQELKELVNSLSLRNVHFFSSQPHNVIPHFYQSSDYFIFPTLEDVWGLVVNEALWSGIPVICSKYAGCARELLPDQNIFDPLNHNEFVKILKQAIQGKISSVDYSKLKPCMEVAEMITNRIQEVLKK